MKVRGKRTLKNGATAGYVKQSDGSWKWRFIKGSGKSKTKIKKKRVLKNGAIGGYVKQSDGSWKWRIIKGPTKKGGMNNPYKWLHNNYNPQTNRYNNPKLNIEMFEFFYGSTYGILPQGPVNMVSPKPHPVSRHLKTHQNINR